MMKYVFFLKCHLDFISYIMSFFFFFFKSHLFSSKFAVAYIGLLMDSFSFGLNE